MKITHSLVVNIQGVTHIVQPKFNRFRALANIHFIFKLSPSNFPKAYSKSLFFSFFLFFVKMNLRMKYSSRLWRIYIFLDFAIASGNIFPFTVRQVRPVFIAVQFFIIIIFCVFFVLIWIDFWEMPQGSS